MANQNLSTRTNAGASVVVVPGTSDGLVSKNGVPGNTGVAVAAGYVGEIVPFASRNVTTASASAWTGAGQSPLATLQPGIWLVIVTMNGPTAAAVTDTATLISSNNNADSTGVVLGQVNIAGAGSGLAKYMQNIGTVTVAPATTQPLYGKAFTVGATGTTGFSGVAIRVG